MTLFRSPAGPRALRGRLRRDAEGDRRVVNELFGIPLGTLLVVLAVGARNRVRGPRRCSRSGTRCSSGSACATSAGAAARTGLIVLGLMLGTTIIAAALVTGDTMSHTIRTTAIAALGESDEVVSAKGAVDDIPGDARRRERDPVVRRERRRRDRVERSGRGSSTASLTRSSTTSRCRRRGRARASRASMLFARRPDRDGRASRRSSARTARQVSLADLRPARSYLNSDAADELGAAAGRHGRSRTPAGNPAYLQVRDVVEFNGAGDRGRGAARSRSRGAAASRPPGRRART